MKRANSKTARFIVSHSQLADLIRRSSVTVTRLIDLGMPVISRGGHSKRSEIDLAKALPWFVEYEVMRVTQGEPQPEEISLREESVRLMRAKADERELRNASLRESLIGVHEARATWESIARAAERKFKPLAATFRRRFPDMPPAAVDELSDLIDGILEELKTFDGTEHREFADSDDDVDGDTDDDLHGDNDDQTEAVLDA